MKYTFWQPTKILFNLCDVNYSLKKLNVQIFMRAGSTVSKGAINYVFVKLKIDEKRMSGVKRVLITPTFKAFKKSCSLMFKTKDPVKVFYDCEGNIIADVNELEPGTTIIASTEEPKTVDDEYESLDQNKKPKFDPHAPLLYTKFPESIPVPVSRNPDSVIVGFVNSLAMDQSRLSTRRWRRERQNKFVLSKWGEQAGPGMKEHHDEDDDGYEYDENDEERGGEGKYINHVFDQTSYSTSARGASSARGTSVAATETQSVLGRPKRFEKKAAAKSRLERVKGLLNGLFKNTDAFAALNQALKNLPEDVSKFVSNADPYEQTQKRAWATGMQTLLKETAFCDTTKGLFLTDEMNGYVKQSLLRQRFIAGTFCSHRFNTAIIGPPKSGKSTLLQMMAEQVTLDMVSADEWKNMFVFLINMKDFAPYFNMLDVFYKEFMRRLIRQLGMQQPAAVKWIPEIRRYFENLLTDPIPLQISKTYIVNPAQKNTNARITAIGKSLMECWKEASSLDWWFTCLMNVAITLPAALGFKKTLFVVDNFEYADVEIAATEPFRGQSAYFGEHLKFVLAKSDYIISCQNTQLLYQAISPVDDDGIDLLRNTSFMTTNGMSENIVARDPPLILYMKNEPVPFVMKGSDCDGIPNYMLLWKDLNDLIDRMELLPEGSDEREDAAYFAVSHAQAICNLMYWDPENPEAPGCPKIIDIRRSSRVEQIELAEEEVHNEQALKEEAENVARKSESEAVEEEEEGEKKMREEEEEEEEDGEGNYSGSEA